MISFEYGIVRIGKCT